MLIPPITAGTGESGDNPLSNTPKELTVNQFLIYLVGLSEGLTHLAALAIYYLFKDDLGLTPPQVSAVFIVPALPWVCKPLLAFCTDSYPIFGYRRKSYMLLFSMLEAFGFVLLASSILPGILGAIICLFIISLSASFCSCVAEGLVVQSSQGTSHKGTADRVADFIGSKAFGSLLVAYFSGYLVERTSKSTIFLTTSMFPLLITFVSVFMTDPVDAPKRNTIGQIRTLLRFVRQPIIWGPALYVFVFMCGPDYDDAFFFFLTNKLGFTPTFMGALRLTYGIAAILGIFTYKYFFYQRSYKTILKYSLLISFPIYISPIIVITGFNRLFGISDRLFVLSGGFLIEATAEIQLLPLLVLIATICPPGLEASMYGLMMSIRNMGGALSRLCSAVLTYTLGITANNFSLLAMYVLFCGCFLLIPLSLLDLIPSEAEAKKQKESLIQEGEQDLLAA